MTQGRVIIHSFESTLLKDNPLKDPHVRPLPIYLPPGYDANTQQKYPVVFLLSGFTSTGIMQLNREAFSEAIDQRLDRLIGSGQIQPMIVVMPDCFTYYGGSQYLDSTALGPYESHLIKELVPYIKENFRTAASSSWAVMGKSSGGYGALVLAMRHPEVFGISACHSGDMAFEYCYQPDFPETMITLEKIGGIAPFMKKFYDLKKKDGGSFCALNIIGMAAAYSPKGKDIELPFDLKTGELIPAIWEKWLAWDPLRMIDKHQKALKQVKIFVDCGIRDEFRLYAGSRQFSAALKRAGIEHTYEEFEDTHMRINYRYDRSLGFISQHSKP